MSIVNGVKPTAARVSSFSPSFDFHNTISQKVCQEYSFPTLDSIRYALPEGIIITEEEFQKENALEREIYTKGIESIRKEIAKAREKSSESNTDYGSKLISTGLLPLAKAIKEEIAEARTGKAGRLTLSASLFPLLPADTLAALTMVVVMQSITTSAPLNATAITLGEAFEDELRRIAFEEQNKEVYKWVVKRAKKSTHYDHIRRLFKGMANRKAIEYLSFERSEKLNLGVRLIELAVTATGFIQLVKVSSAEKGHKKKQGKDCGFSYVIVPTQACLNWIQQRIDNYEGLQPKFLPTLIPPKPWKGPFGGGYYSSSIVGRILVKTPYKGYLEELDSRVEEMPDIYTSINAIQETPWKVNLPVLEAAKVLWQNMTGEDGIAGLPPKEPLTLPPCPVCGASFGDTSPLTARTNHDCFNHCDPALLMRWRQTSKIIWDRQCSLTSRKMMVARILHLAQKYQNESAFYYPHQLDFRGRAYPMPAYLTPQGTDLAKGLLMFSKGKKIGKSGVRWLCIHLANTWGEDKISLESRVNWVKEHEREILETARNPLDFLWWTDADKPFQFLAACFEWLGYTEQGEEFISHIPIAMDGTCNGLQIFSLMLKDEVGGYATNLVPCEEPQDIYAVVAEKAIEKLKTYAENGTARMRTYTNEDGEEAERVLVDEKKAANAVLEMGVNRKTTKRQVMVVPYGGTLTACQRYTIEYVEERADSDEVLSEVFKNAGGRWPCSYLLSETIWEAISETVIAAGQAMKFLQKLASVASKKDLPIIWTTPLGFPVLQAYKSFKMQKCYTQVFGSIYRPKIPSEATTLDKKRQRNGVSPNYVHSLDASALHRTVALASCKGIHNFSMIHDSYATHAADTEYLAELLRTSYVELFTHIEGASSLLAKFRDEIAVMVGEDVEMPELPPTGNLVVDDVLKSKYFFA